MFYQPPDLTLADVCSAASKRESEVRSVRSYSVTCQGYRIDVLCITVKHIKCKHS